MIVFDITDINSFKNVEKWLVEINQECEYKIFIWYVGNKPDLKEKRLVNTKEASKFALKHNLKYIETSAFDS